jgi:DNA helicase II / ATP-dependent DNA helicase PcrA
MWAPAGLDPVALQKGGWTVLSFRDIGERYIRPARSRGTTRASLANPAQPLLDLLAATRALAVVGVSLRTAADLRDLYGFLIEPAYRRERTILIASDRTIDELDPEAFVDPVGFAWTLERLRYVADRFALGPALDGLPPLTPIEAILYAAMREADLAPVAQFGIKRFRADFAFPEVRLVVECDGRGWHDGDRDQRRDAALRREGWEPLHFTGSEIVSDAEACVRRVVGEIKTRRGSVTSEQPPIPIPVIRSWWSRIVEWLRGLSGRTIPLVNDKATAEDRQPASARAVASAFDLDPEQRAAVLSQDGVVQVIAPAGSGKTTVLVARAAELVARGIPPNRILCCTFNRAAADELQARLDQSGVTGVEASTFHAVGRTILREAGLLRKHVGSPSYGQWRRLAKLAMDATEDGVWIDAPDARVQVSDLKLARMLTVQEYEDVASSPAERTLAKLYRLYEDSLVEQDQTDFDDLIFHSVRLLQRDRNARRRWQGEYTAVLVDEYQDIEPAQELLIHTISSPEDLLLSVGDEDQCLYAWRRASVERVIELDQLYPGLERHALVRNYRCPTTVVDASRGLISRNRRRFPKEILAARSDPGEIILAGASDLRAQAAHAARLVQGVEQGQIVVLARTTRVLSEIALGLAQSGTRFFGPERIKRRTGEPAVVLAYLRLLGSPSQARAEDVDQIFRVPNRYLPDDAEVNVASALRSGISFSAALKRLRIREQWREARLAEAGTLFDELATIGAASELIHRLRTDGGLDRHYADAEQLNPTDRSAVDTLAHAEETASGMAVREYAEALDYEANIIEQHFDSKGIELATIHGAKGRQWPTVILVGAEESELPHARSLSAADDPDGELEGERRLAYVAFTRASERLVLLFDLDRPSRFIAEAALLVEMEPVPSLTPLPPPAPTPRKRRSRAASAVLTARRTKAPGPPASATGHRAAPIADTSSDQVTALDDEDPFGLLEGEAFRLAPVERIVSLTRAADGSIPCSMPNCWGWVGEAFVIETPDGLAGLCPRFEVHEKLVAGDRALEGVWIDLQQLNRPTLRRWRSDKYGNTGDEVVCGLPGCGGIVREAYILEVDGQMVGLCPDRTLHDALARRDTKVAAELRRLLQERRMHRSRDEEEDDDPY